jgi:hypothetical protein
MVWLGNHILLVVFAGSCRCFASLFTCAAVVFAGFPGSPVLPSPLLFIFALAIHCFLFVICCSLCTVRRGTANGKWGECRTVNGEWRRRMFAICHLPFTVLHSPFTFAVVCMLPFSHLAFGFMFSLVPICHSPFAIRHVSFAIRHSPFAVRHSPFVIRISPFAIRHVSFAIRHSPFAVRHSPCVIRLSPFAVRRSPFAVRRSPFAVRHSPFVIRLSPFAIHHVSFAICHLPFAVCHSLFASIVLLSSAFPTLVFGPTHFGPMIHLPPRLLP